jgi:hypothetical protein
MSSGRWRRRALQAHHVKAVKQVLAEQALAPPCPAKRFVGGGHDAHIGGDGLFAAHPLELAVLDHPQEGQLGERADLGDLVQKDGAVLSLSKRPFLRRMAPVKEPFSWPNSSELKRVSG